VSSISPVFHKVFAREFYRINAGFFLVVIGICFGFLKDTEHLALAQYFISSPILIFVPGVCWFLYALKVTNFNHLTVRKSENKFIYLSGRATSTRLVFWLAVVAIQQLMPALLYGCFLMVIAYHFDQTLALAEVLAAFVLLISIISWKLYQDIRHPDDERKVSLLRRKINFAATTPFVWFYPAWILRRQPLAVFSTKVFTLLTIIGISRLYSYDSYDERLFEMGGLLAFSSNLVLVYHYHRFENFHFSLVRGFPISLPHRFWIFILSMTILQLPEIGALINYFPEAISHLHLIALVAFGISISCLCYASLFYRDIILEKLIRRVFFMTILWFVLILFGVPIYFLAALQCIVAYALYRKDFYSFEFNAAIGSEK
jgi:hypothetical protein